MKNLLTIECFLLSILTLSIFASESFAQGALATLDTNGTVFQVNHKTAAQTDKGSSLLNNFSLGGTARKGSKFYYVAQPEGLNENAIYTANLSNQVITYVDLDRSDDVRALFLNGKNLYGIFYDGNLGSSGLYRINPKTGDTKLILDLSELDLDPIPGAIAKLDTFYYMLAKPEIDANARSLVRFKIKAGSAKVFTVADKLNAPILCNKLKVNKLTGNFICLASNSDETQVDVCKLNPNGKAAYLKTLPDILRVGSGHTLVTLDGKIFYAFVYAPGEENNQRLIKFNTKGALKANTAIDGIMIGAHFANEEVPSIP